MKKIRVLMVMGSTNMGGAQMFILNLLRNMDLTQYQIDFAVNFEERDGGIGQELIDLGCRIFKLPYFKVYNYIPFVKAWKNFLQTHNYDIIHGHSTNSAGIYLNVAKKIGITTISHCHSAGFRGNWPQRLIKKNLIKRIRSVADYWFACSAVAAEHLYGKGYYDYVNYYDIPNAINAEKYLYNETIAKDIKSKLNISDDVFLCGHVGSFTAPKNHIFLIEIFNKLLSIRPNAKLLCCGDGPLKEQVIEKAKSLGILDRIIFAGIIKNINEYMMAMDVLIFPSLFEGFPVSIIEAEATGLPIVMSDVITTEVDVTDCIHRLPLNFSPLKWAEVIASIETKDRTIYNSAIADSKYDMRISAETIDSLYKKMIKE